MKRRDFLQLSAYAGLALGIPFLPGCKGSPANMAIIEAPFLSHIFDKKTIMETGKDYIRQFPKENTKGILEEQLLANSPITPSTPAAEVHSYFDKKTVDDFKHNNTVVVDGWVLSRTEAKQCALFELVHE